MVPIVTPLAAAGFSPRALSMLATSSVRSAWPPWRAAAAAETDHARKDDRPLVPGSPFIGAWSWATSTSRGSAPSPTSRGIGSTASAIRCSSLGACELPMMTGYIHTVYPRASVSMKMGSPLKVVGVLDTDVSTCVAGRVGAVPDMLPMTVKVKTGRYADPRHVSRPDRPRAEPAAEPDHVRAHQRHRHRGEPPRGADRAT